MSDRGRTVERALSALRAGGAGVPLSIVARDTTEKGNAIMISRRQLLSTSAALYLGSRYSAVCAGALKLAAFHFGNNLH